MQGSKAEDGGNCRLDRMNADSLGSGNWMGGSTLLAIIIPTISYFIFEAAHECRYVRCVAAAEESKTGRPPCFRLATKKIDNSHCICSWGSGFPGLTVAPFLFYLPWDVSPIPLCSGGE